MWQIIRPQIVQMLNGITELQEVSPTPKVKFNGYPLAHAIPSDNSNEYNTTSENERIYAFIVRAFYETKSGGVEEAFVALEKVVDKIIDEFDLEGMRPSEARTIGLNLPERYTFISVFATPSRWGDLPEEELVMAEISVRVKVSVDVSY